MAKTKVSRSDKKPPDDGVGKLTAAMVVVVILGVVAALVIPRLAAAPEGGETTPTPVVSCMDGRFTGFFSKPVVTEEDLDFQSRFEDYVTNLSEFLCEEGVNLSDYQDPLSGHWKAEEEGDFWFFGEEFRWSAGESGELSFQGVYTWLPGCEWEGFELGRAGASCYTVFMRFEQTMNEGVLTDDIYYSGFMVAVETSERVSLFDMRSGGAFYISKVAQ